MEKEELDDKLIEDPFLFDKETKEKIRNIFDEYADKCMCQRCGKIVGDPKDASSLNLGFIGLYCEPDNQRDFKKYYEKYDDNEEMYFFTRKHNTYPVCYDCHKKIEDWLLGKTSELEPMDEKTSNELYR